MTNLKKIQIAPLDEAIEFIINQKDMNICNEEGYTMLHCSCTRIDGLPLVELLLYLGIDKERKDNYHRTASNVA